MNRIQFAALVVLALVLAGCCAQPSFAPDGKSLAYVRGNALILRNSGHDQKIFGERPDDLKWSPDGQFLAWSKKPESMSYNGQTITTPAVTWIRALKSGKTCVNWVVGGSMGWLKGELVVADESGGKHRLALLDPNTARVRSELKIDSDAEMGGASANRNELYVCIGVGPDRPVYSFDGSQLTRIPGPKGMAPIPTSGPEPVFLPAEAFLAGKRVRPLRWVGKWTAIGSEIRIPDRVEGQLVISPLELSVSTDGDSLACLVATLRGTSRQERHVERYLRAHHKSNVGLMQASNPALEKLTKRMDREMSTILVWRHGLMRVIHGRRKAINMITLDPCGTRLALCNDVGPESLR